MDITDLRLARGVSVFARDADSIEIRMPKDGSARPLALADVGRPEYTLYVEVSDGSTRVQDLAFRTAGAYCLTSKTIGGGATHD